MTKKKPKSEHKTVGRKTIMTENVLNKLQEAFLKGYSNRAACIYADIIEGTFYKYCLENPEFVEKKEAWQENPISKARDVIYDSIIAGDPQTAKWYLERKAKEEFSTRSELTGKDGVALVPDPILRDDIRKTD